MDWKTHIIELVSRSGGHCIKDIEALEEPLLLKTYGGSSRSVADVVTEIVAINKRFLTRMQGGDPGPFKFGEWMVAPDDMKSKAAIIAALTESISQIVALGESSTEAELSAVIETPTGPTSRYDLLLFSAMHMTYHNGQFNYIQTMQGDSEVHWF